MRSRIVRSAVMTAAVLAFAAATVVVADQPEQRAAQGRGDSMPAKSVLPGSVVKKFQVTAFDGQIAPSTLRVKRGENVRITFVSKDSTYGISFKDFHIKTKVTRDKPALVEFVPSSPGTYAFQCSRFMGMKKEEGTLIVE